MKKITKFINLLFIILIITSVLPYIIQVIETIINGRYILWSMSNNVTSKLYIGKLFPYIKDCVAVILFIILIIYFKKTRKTALIYLGIVFYGTLILFINKCYEIGYIIAGIRMFLYFFLTIMYFQTSYTDMNNFTNIHKTLKILIIIEAFLVFVQVGLSGQITNFGNRSYRFCGTFGNAGGLGNFTIASSLYIMLYNHLIAKKVKNSSYIYLAINFLLSVAAGSRIAILLNALIIFLYWNNFSFKKLNISKKMKILIIFSIVIIAMPIIYNFAVNRIGRGPIMDSGITRIEILLSFFDINNLQELCNLVIGKGIGVASNNAYLLKLDSATIVDGTINTIIAQFGLIGVTIIVATLIKIISMFWKYSNKNINLTLAYFGTIILVIAGGNIFEQIAMIILIVTEYFMLKGSSIKE